LRKRSKVVLGNKDRAEVGAAIGLSEDGVVNATDLALELGLPNSRVRAQLLALTEGEMLEPQPSISGKHLYARVESPLWEACIDLIQKSVSEPPSVRDADEPSVAEDPGDG
jgi:hypothetical protein